MKKQILILAVMVVLLSPSHLFAQYFGKNKVQYTDFQWKFIQSTHFDIYFTEGGESIADFVATAAEESYESLKDDFRYELTDRITIIVHNSHNDFEQTNVDLSPPEESVGGFTEFFKNRVVIPFDGSWERLRHVTHHELTHAVMLQMVYGGFGQSIVMGIQQFQLPLWFIEGLAEYESRRWDTESDMFMRDAAVNNYVPPSFDYMGGFLAYKGGQSVWYYIAEKYGQEKVGEVLGKVKIYRSLDKGLKAAIGVDSKELAEKWLKHLKQNYWPDVAGRKEPGDFAKPLTDHRKWGNFVNNSPALSPKGDKIAFLSDKSDYFDIYLMSAIDGKLLAKLVSGQKKGNLEELHWLRPGISWSPDGQFIVFAAKAGKEDALNIVNVKKKKIVKSKTFGLDGVFSPTWSPKGGEIAFVGFMRGQSDIYAWNTLTGELRKITDDVFSDLEPNWSPDGKTIAFVSDRGWCLNPKDLPADFRIDREDYSNLDVYVVSATGEDIYRVTDTPSLERTPVFSPTDANVLAFTSDRSGVFNIYLRDLQRGGEYPITDVLAGISHLSWGGDGSKLAFVSFGEGGYDIYLLNNPLLIRQGEVNPVKTNFIVKREKEGAGKHGIALANQPPRKEKTDNFRHFVFGQDFSRGWVEPALVEEKPVALDSSEHLLPNGHHKVRKYKPKFTADIVYGNAGYSPYFGLQGTNQLSFSDVLGNHRINIYSQLYYSFKNSNLALSYFYLPKRTDIGVGAFQTAYYFLTSYGFLIRDRSYGANLFLSRPFDRYRRLECGFTALGIARDWPEFEGLIPTYKRWVVLNELSYVTDTSLWGFTGPVNGTRSIFSVTYSPNLGRNALAFLTLRGEWRRYFKLKNEYSFAARFAGGFSEGKTPQRFFLGGVDNWLNRRYSGGYLRVDRIEDIYFSRFETPFRGLDYYERIGDRFFLTNLELRFPLLRYLVMGFPLPLTLYNVRGALFTDIGSAWEKQNGFRPWGFEDGSLRLRDLAMTFGTGARMNIGFAVFMFDVGWRTDLASTSKPRYLFSLGVEY